MEEISKEDFLLRRIPIAPSHIKEDGTISSAAFMVKKGEDGLSVDLERCTTFEESIIDRKKYRLARLKASQPISLGLKCLHNPMPENYAHSLIIGQITKPISKILASYGEFIQEIEKT